MKKCLYCDTIIEEKGIYVCPECGGSWFRPGDLFEDEMIEQAFRKFGIAFFKRKDENTFKKQFKDQCKASGNVITQEFVDQLMPDLKRSLKRSGIIK